MMRRLAFVLALALASGLTVSAQEPAAPASTEEAVRSAERARFAAMTAKAYTALATMLGDDLVYTHSNAQRDSKADFLKSLTSGAVTYLKVDPSDQVVKVYGTTAIIVGAATITTTSGGTERTTALRYTDVWVQRDGRWQMVAWQSTRLPE